MSVWEYVAVAVAGYGAAVVVVLLVFPDRRCRWCSGEGCRFCGLTGRQDRAGARIVRRVARRVTPRRRRRNK